MLSIAALLEGPEARPTLFDDVSTPPFAAASGPLQLLSALRVLSETADGAATSQGPTTVTMEPEDVLQLEMYDRLRLVDRIHDIRPECLPSYEQANGPGDYLATDREELLHRLRQAVCARRRGERDWRILTRRFGIGCDPAEKLEEIGCEHGLPRERVRQIIDETLEFLRVVLENDEAPAADRLGRNRLARRRSASILECKPLLRRRCA